MFFSTVLHETCRSHNFHPNDSVVILFTALHNAIISRDLDTSCKLVSILFHNHFLRVRPDVLQLVFKAALHNLRAMDSPFSTIDSFFKSFLEFLSVTPYTVNVKLAIRRFILHELALFHLSHVGPLDALSFFRQNATDPAFENHGAYLRGLFGIIGALVIHKYDNDIDFPLSEVELNRCRQEAVKNLSVAISKYPNCQIFIDAAVYVFKSVGGEEEVDTSSVGNLLTLHAQANPSNPNAWRGLMEFHENSDDFFDYLTRLLDADPLAVDAVEIAVTIALESRDSVAVKNVLDRLIEAICNCLDLNACPISLKLWFLLIKVLTFAPNQSNLIEVLQSQCSWWLYHFFSVSSWPTSQAISEPQSILIDCFINVLIVVWPEEEGLLEGLKALLEGKFFENLSEDDEKSSEDD
ncbi:hypothetical protein RCL1_008947 [Eukaryota sp. TZLM3-RCL]